MAYIRKCRLNIMKKTQINTLLIFAIIFFAAIIILNGCSGRADIKTLVKNKLTSEDEINVAVAIVEEFFNYLKSEDYEKAYGLLSSKDKGKHDLSDFKEEFKNVTRIIEVETNWVEIKNNIANVGIDLTDLYDGGEKVYKDLIVSLLKGEDGSWGINFWH